MIMYNGKLSSLMIGGIHEQAVPMFQYPFSSGRDPELVMSSYSYSSDLTYIIINKEK